MAITITDYLKIDKTTFDKTNAFDSFLDINSNLFVSPMLLKRTNNKYFKDCYEKLLDFFESIIHLLQVSKNKKDRYWNRAVDLLVSKEEKGISLGYAKNSKNGSGISKMNANDIIDVVDEFLEKEIIFPEIFEIMCVFEKGIGPDKISDIILDKIKESIYEYSNYVFSKFNISKKLFTVNEKNYYLPVNDFNNTPILVIDKSLLLDLPVIGSFYDIDFLTSYNQKVREQFSQYIAISNRRKKLNKDEVKRLFMNFKDFRDTFIEKYRTIDVSPYDFKEDRNCICNWYYNSKYCFDNPLELKDKSSYGVVKEIISKFKGFIENNKGWRFLYDDNKHILSEKAPQTLFHSFSYLYCDMNDIDLSCETNNGNGPVDFKLSRGSKDKIIVEVKKSNNTQLRHCYETQIPLYMVQENIKQAIYLLIDYGINDKTIENFKNYINNNPNDKIELIIIDGSWKESASKRK